MKTGQPYFIKVAMETNRHRDVTNVSYAECKRCPAGKAPSASCKHMAAFFYALEEFERLGYTRELVACTDELQRWNHPRKRKAEVHLAADIDWSRAKLPAGHAKKARKKAALADRRHPDDRGKARLDQMVEAGCAAGRLTGLSLTAMNKPTTVLINRKLREKRLCHMTALKKRWDGVLQKETLARMQVTVKHDHTYFDQPTSIMSVNTRPLEQSLQEGSPEMIH